MKKMSKMDAVAAVCAVVLPFAGLADGIIPVKNYSNKLTLAVNSTTTLEAALAAAGASVSDLTGNVYDCLEKSGTGSLQMNVSLAGFMGDIFVTGGRLDVSVSSALGSATTVAGGETNGFVVVESSATVAWTGSESFSAADKTMFIAGTGDDGNGALQALMTVGQQKGVFGKCMVLTADASAYVSGANAQDMREDKTIVLNNFKLSICTDNNKRAVALRPNAVGPGKIELGRGTFALSTDLNFSGDANDELIANGAIFQYSAAPMDNLSWTFVVAVPTTLNLRAAEGAAGGSAEWSCPIRLDSTLTLTSGDTQNPYIKLSGPISGTGSMFVKGTDPESATAAAKGIKVALANDGNTFSGGIAAQYATLCVADGALPTNGGAAAFTNSTLSVLADTSVNLPPCKFAGACLVGNARAANFAALEVDDGASLAFDKVESLVVPGLWYGEDTTVQWTTVRYLGGTYDPSAAYSNEVVMSLHKTAQGSTVDDATGGCLYTYSGYIINTDVVDRVWSFSGVVKYRSRLFVNGVAVYSQTDASRYAGQATLHPGANAFLFQATTQNTGTGTLDRKSGTKTVTFEGESETETDASFLRGGSGVWAFVIDRQGRNPLSPEMMSYSNWEVPVDPGDGSLFAIATTREECEAQGLPLPSITAASATFGVGSTIDVGGRDLSISNLTGAATISNAVGSVGGNSVAITGLWTLEDATLAASSVLESDRTVSFGPASTFSVVPDGRDTKYGDVLSIAHSDIAISGMPACVQDGSGRMRWQPLISNDGKMLSVRYNPIGFIISFR